MRKLLLVTFCILLSLFTTAATSVVIIDNIIAPTGEYKIGDVVEFTFDLHNMGPDATINPIVIKYALPTGLSLASGSSSIFSQSGNNVTGTQSSVLAVGGKVTYKMRFLIESSSCPATSVGGSTSGCSSEGFLSISGGAELSPGYLRWREWTAWGTGGRENYAAERISLYFPVGQNTPTSSTTLSPANKGTAPAADIAYTYDDDHTTINAGVISQSGTGTRRTWEWYGIIVPDETTQYTFCGSGIDDGWAAWISDGWNPEAPQSLDPSQMTLIGENYTYQSGTNISTASFDLVCGRPYFFRIVVSSRNSGKDDLLMGSLILPFEKRHKVPVNSNGDQ